MELNIVNEKFKAVCKELDRLHAGDPVKETKNGISYPRELLYIERLVEYLDEIKPGAGEIIQLAIRCQHLCRWQVPRNSYPMTRSGYLIWRNALFQYQVQIASGIMKNAGYDKRFVDQVMEIISKRNLKDNPDTQLLEDIVCLVFIKFYLFDFAKQHPETKVLSIVKKTWAKMSDEAKENAMSIDLPNEVRHLIDTALQ
jgi:hypothetical protein